MLRGREHLSQPSQIDNDDAWHLPYTGVDVVG